MLVRVADEERAALGDEVDDLPAFETHFVEGGDVHRGAIGRIAEHLAERQEQAFVDENFAAFLHAAARTQHFFSELAFLLGFDFIYFALGSRVVENFTRVFAHFARVALSGAE